MRKKNGLREYKIKGWEYKAKGDCLENVEEEQRLKVTISGALWWIVIAK